ncbi:MAG: ABC transporter ATP-binding protein [Lysobacterales bacterium]|nr:MAG: ABC transporter ATP-binding protein [Xanthomonadales bacterium]
MIDYRGMHALLERAVRAPFAAVARRVRSGRGSSEPAHIRAHLRWAIRNVSFTVAQGEVLGIVGQNGAGKSVLLKILSRITRPTEGRARLRGSVSTLLEAGTGFHPELTGRENIRLSGAILGMSKQQIEHRMEEIIAFAEIDEFLDTPIKHYSSGMVLRLGFSVSAHLEADIMLIDEVLTVGDENFQRRCIDKMRSVVGSGRTVLFVSHDLDAVKLICHRAILIRNGGIELDGPPDQVVAAHLGGGR